MLQDSKCCVQWNTPNKKIARVKPINPTHGTHGIQTSTPSKVSYLSIALQRQTERRQLNQSDIARAGGLSRSYISRLFSGESHELSDQNFVALLRIFAADPVAQAELIAARCQDAKAAATGTPGADLVEIRVKATAPAEKSEFPFPQVHLSLETERAFAWLRAQCPLNPDLEQHLVGYARLTGMR